jgi:hypothetical protein
LKPFLTSRRERRRETGLCSKNRKSNDANRWRTGERDGKIMEGTEGRDDS